MFAHSKLFAVTEPKSVAGVSYSQKRSLNLINFYWSKAGELEIISTARTYWVRPVHGAITQAFRIGSPGWNTSISIFCYVDNILRKFTDNSKRMQMLLDVAFFGVNIKRWVLASIQRLWKNQRCIQCLQRWRAWIHQQIFLIGNRFQVTLRIFSPAILFK